MGSLQVSEQIMMVQDITRQNVTGPRSRDRSTPVEDDPHGVWSSVAQCIEQLGMAKLTSQQKELSSKQLLDLVNGQDDARIAAGCHSQAIPVLVSVLRSGTPVTKINAAVILAVLCKEKDLRIKVLLGGSVPPLLALLNSGSLETQLAAAKALYAVSQGGQKDNVGPKIFSTESMASCLYTQLKTSTKFMKLANGILTGALRNICTKTEGFWEATAESGGVDILLKLLPVGTSEAQSNACYLLANIMMEEESICIRIMQAGAIDQFLKLLSSLNELSVRAEAAGALKVLSFKHKESRRYIINSNGIPYLLNATVAPSKESLEGELAQALQENAMGALANISGGLHSVILSLADRIESNESDVQMADTVGALASALMVFDGKAESPALIKPTVIEQILIKQLKPHASILVQERIVEALASLYGNIHLASGLQHCEGKKMLIGLITMTSDDVREEFLKSFKSLCNTGSDLWHSIHKRQGIQLLISLLGVSTEHQQECAVALLSILSQERDESKWAITAAGGIPPLVQLLETGSIKAKGNAAIVLGNLCSDSEDIRSCVERADAVPALLLLLKYADSERQEIAAWSLKQLVHGTDVNTISQLNALLAADLPTSKFYLLEALGHLISVSPLVDMLSEGGAVNEAFKIMVAMLESSNEESQQQSASALAKIFESRKDLHENPIVSKSFAPLLKLLNARLDVVAMQASRCLSALFASIKENGEVASAAKDAIIPLVYLAKSPSLEVTEHAISALANILLDPEMVEEVPTDELILPMTKVLREGTAEGKSYAAGMFASILQSRCVDDNLAENIYHCGTVLALVALLATANVEDTETFKGLEALASLARAKTAGEFSHPPWVVLVEAPYSIGPLITCLAAGQPHIQEKAVEFLSRLCRDQPSVLGDMIIGTSSCIAALANLVFKGSSLEVKIGATSLLICAAKEHPSKSIDFLIKAMYLVPLVQALVNMVGSKQDELRGDKTGDGLGYKEFTGDMCRSEHYLIDYLDNDPAATLGGTAALWLLSILASHKSEIKMIVTEAGAIEIMTAKIKNNLLDIEQNEGDGNGKTWLNALLLAIIFQDRDVNRAPAAISAIPVLANLLKSEEAADRYFAAQALASLVCNGNRGIVLAVANSGSPAGLISLLGSEASKISNFLALAEEFSLLQNPEQIVLERLFRVDDNKVGSVARKAIPALVELIKPIADRPGAPVLALRLLTQLAQGSDAHKLAMAEAGALEALTKYLSLGPQDNMEENIADLLRILFSSAELRWHKSAVGTLNQLIAVLHLGARGARYSATRALHGLFAAEYIRNSDAARKAIPPLLDMLRTGSETEQKAAVGALIKLSYDNPFKALLIADAQSKSLEVLCRILSTECSLKLKEEVAELCCVLFSYERIRSTPAATNCIEPLVMLLGIESGSPSLAIVHALSSLVENKSLAELAEAQGVVTYLIRLLSSEDHGVSEAAVNALIKLGRNRPQCKLDMMKFGVIDKVLQILPMVSDSHCASIAELLRILTNNISIAEDVAASRIVEPLLVILSHPGLGVIGQHSTMQALLNILEKSRHLENCRLLASQTIDPLMFLLDSPSASIRLLTAELLSQMLAENYYEHDAIPQKVAVAFVQLLELGVPIKQEKAIMALENASKIWPKAIADAGGIDEVSNIILQIDPLPPHALWESAASVIRSILQYNSQYCFHVPVQVLVRMLQSSKAATIIGALQGLLLLEKEDAPFSERIAESGGIEALLELLRCHQYEEVAAQVLETLLSNKEVRGMKVAFTAISPLSQYVLDPQTQKPARLLAVLALGDMFQNQGLSQSSDAILACQALVSLLEEQPTEDIRTVALCALQNLVGSSRKNKLALAEAGGVHILRELLFSGEEETARQVAKLIKLLVSNPTNQEYASSDFLQALSVALENDIKVGSSTNADILQAIVTLLSNFAKLRGTEAATLTIPHLTTALKVGPQAVQDAALEALCLLRQAWPIIPPEVGKAQAMAASEVIPLLQTFTKSGPQQFHERACMLLQCLPGSLVVTIKRGNNLRRSMGGTSAFCKIALGNAPPKQTRIVPRSTAPEWNEELAWELDTPPKGHKLRITCKSQNCYPLGKGSLGKVRMVVDDGVVRVGSVSGEYRLVKQKKAKELRGGGSLEVEVRWSEMKKHLT